jgi:hypothetical protein
LSKPNGGVPGIKHTGFDRLIETGWRADELEVHWLSVFGEGVQHKVNGVRLWQRASG